MSNARRAFERRPLRNAVRAVANGAAAPTGVAAPTGIEYLSGAQNGTVTGSGFVNGAVAYVDGVAMTTVFNSSSSLTVTFAENIFWPNDAFTHTRSLTVANPSSPQSAAATMTIVVPATTDDAWRADQCTTVTGAVSAAPGIFGTGHNLSQGTAGNRPTYNATGLNSKPTWSGGGTKSLTSTSFAVTQPFGWLVVLKQNASTNGNFVIGSSGGTGFGSIYQVGFITDFGFAAGGFVNGKNLPLGTWGALYTKYNGASGGQTVNNKYSQVSNAGTNAFSTGFTLFAASGGGTPANVDIAEVWLIKGTPSATFFTQFQKYVDYRYFGLTDNSVTRNVVCHGDSRTAGTGANTSYVDQLNYILGSKYNCKNSGVVGATSADCITNFAVQVTAKYDATKAKNIYVLDIGINDFNASVAPATLKDNINSLFALARAAGFNWCHLNGLCAGVYSADAAGVRDAKEAARVDFMTNYRSLCTADSFGTLNTALDDQADTAVTTVYADLLHLTDYGYSLQALSNAAGVIAAG